MNYGALVTEVLAENRQVLEAVNPDDVELFLQEILKAKAIQPMASLLEQALSCSLISS